MAEILQLLLLAGVFCLFICALYQVVSISPQITIAIILLCEVIDTPNLGLHVGIQIAGINIYPYDAVCALLVLSTLTSISLKSSWSFADKCFLILTLLICIGLVTWCLQTGLKNGFNHWRFEIYLVAIYWWSRSKKIPLDQLARPVTLVALFTVGLQFYLGIERGFGSAVGGYYDAALQSWIDGRPVNSQCMFIVLCAFFMQLTSGQPWSIHRIALLCIFTASLLFSQQRAVWAAGILGVSYLIFVDSWRRGWGKKALLPMLLTGGVLVPGLYLIFTNSSELMQSATSNATLLARLGFWSDRLSFDLNATQWLFGETFGPTPVSLASGWEFQIQAHNAYVQFFNTNGFIGFGLMLAFLVSRIRNTIRLHDATQATLLVSVATYGFFYFYPAYTAIFLADNDEKIEAEDATEFRSRPSSEHALGVSR